MLAAVNFNILPEIWSGPLALKISIDCRDTYITSSSVHNRFSGPASGNSRCLADSKEPHRGGNEVVKRLEK